MSFAHFFGEKTGVGVIGTFHIHFIVIGFFLHMVLIPVDSKFGDPRFIGENGPPGMGGELLLVGIRSIFFG